MQKIFTLIWVDENSLNGTVEIEKTIQELRKINGNVNLFVSIDESLKFIRDSKNEEFVVVTSGSLGRTLVPQLDPLENVRSILIYCGTKIYHEAWAKNWKKIMSVETEIEKICSTISSISVENSMDDDKFLMASDWKNLDLEFSVFVILKEVFSSMKNEEDDPTEFVRSGWTFYKSDAETMKSLDEFRWKFHRSDAMSWFRSKNFIKTLLGKALNQFDVKLLLESRFFINALDENIRQLNSKLYSDRKTYYCMEIFSSENFSKVSSKEKKLMLWKNFLIAKSEIPVWPQAKSGEMTVLLKIEVPPSISKRNFGSSDASEIFFSFGSIFRVEKVRVIETNLRSEIDLILTNNEFFDATKIEFSDDFGFVRIGRKLLDFGRIGDAEAFYQILVENPSLKSQRTFYLYHLARVKSLLGKIEESITLMESCVVAAKENSLEEMSYVLPLEELSFLHEQIGNLEKTLLYKKEILRARKNFLPDNDPSFVEIFQTLAEISRKLNDFPAALNFSFQALRLQENILPENHPDFVFSFSSIGRILEEVERLEEAKTFYEKAFQIKSKTLPPSHPQLLEDFDRLTSISLKLKNFDEAKTFFDKSIFLRQQISKNAH